MKRDQSPFRNDWFFALVALSAYCVFPLLGLYLYSGSLLPNTNQSSSAEAATLWGLWAAHVAVPLVTLLWWLVAYVRSRKGWELNVRFPPIADISLSWDCGRNRRRRLFDELTLSGLIPWAIAAVIVSGGVGFLRPSRLRSWLIWTWSLLPLLSIVPIFIVSRSIEGLPFLALLLAFLLLPWAALTTLSYNLVRRSREISPGG